MVARRRRPGSGLRVCVAGKAISFEHNKPATFGIPASGDGRLGACGHFDRQTKVLNLTQTTGSREPRRSHQCVNSQIRCRGYSPPGCVGCDQVSKSAARSMLHSGRHRVPACRLPALPTHRESRLVLIRRSLPEHCALRCLRPQMQSSRWGGVRGAFRPTLEHHSICRAGAHRGG